ncbi:MAG TPA: LysR family transcriptional regulator [Sphingobium sp.]
MMDPDYDLFLAVVEAGSLSAAARARFMSPAMVSKRLGRLEERLQTRLLHRSTRRMALTPKGERLHADLLAISTAISEAEARVAGNPGQPAGPLRVSAPTSFGRMHLAPHIARFLALNPKISLSLDLGDAFTDLYSSRIDVAIRISATVDPGLTAHRLATSRRVLCAAPAYLAAHGKPCGIESLLDHRLLAASGQLPWQLTGPAGPISFEANSIVATNSSEVVRELAISGAGIALRSLWDVSEELASGRLVQVLPDHEGSSDVAIFAVHPPMPVPSPTLSAFIAFVKALYDPSPPWAS